MYKSNTNFIPELSIQSRHPSHYPFSQSKRHLSSPLDQEASSLCFMESMVGYLSREKSTRIAG